MGLRCSLTGHDFGDPEVDRDREQRGSEVVVTITEFERCRRCGTTSVLSENTEVTTVEPPPSEAEDLDETDPDAEIDDTVETPGEAGSFDTDRTVDDGVILEDEPDGPPGRSHGEWPEAPDGNGSETPSDGNSPDWPTVEGDDEGFTAVPAGRDSTGSNESATGTATDVDAADDREPGRWIEAPAEADADGTSGRAGAVAPEAGEFVRAGDAPAPTDPVVDRGGPTEIYCPNCGSTELGTRHSLRAGDICPECRSGYVAEREL